MVNNWRSDRVFLSHAIVFPRRSSWKQSGPRSTPITSGRGRTGITIVFIKKDVFLTKLAFDLNELIGLGNFHLNELIEPGLP